MQNTKLNVVGFGLAFGITWSISMFLLGLFSLWWNWGTGLVTGLSTLYIGFAPTFWGSVIGAIWGFCDCFIGGVLVAWLYNKFSKENPKMSKND